GCYKTLKKCKKVKGVCQSSSKECDGEVILKGCKGEDCQCCAPKPIGCTKTLKKCKKAKGVCQSNSKECDGEVIPKGCKDEGCQCCATGCTKTLKNARKPREFVSPTRKNVMVK
ncbi:unnamed protein product, partial [Meganyctiphanes norvegica]